MVLAQPTATEEEVTTAWQRAGHVCGYRVCLSLAAVPATKQGPLGTGQRGQTSRWPLQPASCLALSLVCRRGLPVLHPEAHSATCFKFCFIVSEAMLI